MHEVNILENTPLHRIVKAKTMHTNTYHHQAVKKLADFLQVMAKTEDEIIEAVYYTGESYIHGYQWHPEKLFAEDDSNRAIFKDFIKNTQKKL
jgi:putative glutamine amidotransferase